MKYRSKKGSSKTYEPSQWWRDKEEVCKFVGTEPGPPGDKELCTNCQQTYGAHKVETTTTTNQWRK